MQDIPDHPIIRDMERFGEVKEPVIHGWNWWKEDREYGFGNDPFFSERFFETNQTRHQV